jgi:Periplasmic binding protein domain
VITGREYDTPDWSPDQAQLEMEQAITALGLNKIIGVHAANDGTASGAIAAMKGAAGFTTLPPVTGQDAELAAVQRILTGEQYMTVYKAIKPEAQVAAGREAAHRPQSPFQLPMVGFDPVAGVPFGAVPRRRRQLVEHSQVGRCLVGGHLRRPHRG